MSKPRDPFYERKPVPNDFIEHVGYTGLTPGEETVNRERKFSVNGGDIRRFSNPKPGGKTDPFYQRKPVPDSLIHGVAPTGLTHEEEFLNRERKYSVNGADVRKFSDTTKGGWHPTDDPYYGRKAVKKPQIEGVGETGLSKAEEFDSRENKASLFDLSSDPFQQVTGTGHRASISGGAAPVAAAARRRSSAVAPDLHHSEHEHAHQHHSGYEGNNLQTIESRVDGDEIRPSTDGHSGSSGAYPTNVFTSTGPTTTTTTTTTTAHGLNPATSTSINPVSSSLDPASDVQVRDDSGHHVGTTGHTAFYDQATRDLDNIGPHDKV